MKAVPGWEGGRAGLRVVSCIIGYHHLCHKESDVEPMRNSNAVSQCMIKIKFITSKRLEMGYRKHMFRVIQFYLTNI